MKRYVREGLEGCQAQERLSLWSGGAPLSGPVDVFTNPEALQTVYRFLWRLCHVGT